MPKRIGQHRSQKKAMPKRIGQHRSQKKAMPNRITHHIQPNLSISSSLYPTVPFHCIGYRSTISLMEFDAILYSIAPFPTLVN